MYRPFLALTWPWCSAAIPADDGATDEVWCEEAGDRRGGSVVQRLVHVHGAERSGRGAAPPDTRRPL